MKSTLAALLHDIGKFFQRTGYKLNLNKYLKYLVFKNNKYYYWHSAYTTSFIENFISKNQESN